MKIRVHGMLGTYHSWSLTTQALVRAMVKIGGHEIFLKSTNNLENFPEDLKDLLLPGYHGALVQGDANYIDGQGNEITITPKNREPEIRDLNRPYDLEFCYTIPYQHPRRFYPESRCRAVVWNFESSILPPGWHYYSRAVDYMLPSSQFSYDIFAQNGIPEEKLVVVPHGVDTNIFNPDIPPFKLKTKKRVKLLHNAIPHHRKLHERVIKGYIDTFTGNDDVCLVLKTKFVKPPKEKPFEVDVKEILTKALQGKRNPPEIEVINDKFISNIGSLYTACDAVVSMSSTEGFCLLPGTPVDTIYGTESIENLSTIDQVYTHLGNAKYISSVMSRNIDEEIVKMRRHGCDDYFCGTINHPHLVVKRKNKKFSTLKKDMREGKLETQWVGLKDVEKGDLVVIAKPKLNFPPQTTIDLKDHLLWSTFEEKNGKIWLKGSFKKSSGNSSLREIAKRAGCSIQHASQVVNVGTHSNTDFNKNIIKIAKELKYVKPQPIKFNRFIKIDSVLAQFFGLYIAEGSVSGLNAKSFNINLHDDENYGKDLVRSICKRFDMPFCEIKYGKKYQLSGSSHIFSILLSRLFGSNALNKMIPFAMLNTSFIKDIIHGIFYGDGSASRGKYSFSTSSRTLRDQIFQVLLHHGIFSNLRTDRRREHENYIIEIASTYNEKFSDFANPVKYTKKIKLLNTNKNSAIIEGRDHFLVPVRDVYKEHHKGTVYNLEVEDDSTFNSLGMSTHNCLPLLEALACEKLIIAPRHGGQLDFLNDENSILVDTGEMQAPATMQYWGYMKGAVVGDPDIEHYKEMLKHVYDNLDEEKNRIREPAKKTVNKFTWEAAAQMILDLPIPEKSFKLHSKKRVLYIVPYKMVGGGEVWIREAISRLDRAKYEPHVALVSGSSPELEKLFEGLGITIEDLSNNLTKDGALKCLIEAGNYDIIHFYNSVGVYRIIREACRQMGFRGRVVETVHSELLWADSMSKVSSREQFVSVIAAVSNAMARKLLSMGNKNVVSMPQHVDWNRFLNLERSKDILEKHSIPKNFVVGFVGRLSPEKNIPALLECARILRDVSFVVIGDGPQKEPLSQIARELKNVFFMGRRTDLERWYPAFDLLMLPSTMEGMPLVVLEAMASGTPVVASDVGAMSEVVLDGITGSLVWNPKNPVLFANVIKSFKTNSVLWNRCSANARMVAASLREKSNGFNINHLYRMLEGGGN